MTSRDNVSSEILGNIYIDYTVDNNQKTRHGERKL